MLLLTVTGYVTPIQKNSKTYSHVHSNFYIFTQRKEGESPWVEK